jgi:hypothetical protein
MNPQGNRQFNIRCATGTGDKNEVMLIFCFGKDLVQVSAQHVRADNGKMNARQERNCAWLFS